MEKTKKHVHESGRELHSQQDGPGIATGAGVGAALGVAMNNIALWMGVGLAIGVALGDAWSEVD